MYQYVRRKQTTGIVYHHSEIDSRNKRYQFAGIKKDHMSRISKNGKPWEDIGYHVFIEWDGKIEWGRPLWAWGAHSTRTNSRTIGVCFAGNFLKHGITQAQINSGRKVTAMILAMYGLNFDKNTHRHDGVDKTDCPGTLDIKVLKPLSITKPKLPSGVKLPVGVDENKVIEAGAIIATGFLLLFGLLSKGD